MKIYDPPEAQFGNTVIVGVDDLVEGRWYYASYQPPDPRVAWFYCKMGSLFLHIASLVVYGLDGIRADSAPRRYEYVASYTGLVNLQEWHQVGTRFTCIEDAANALAAVYYASLGGGGGS